MPNSENNNTDNKSLFFYTGLIFIVAIIMVIIAFFGQSNLQKNQPIQSEAVSTSSITEKAAQLSDDNRILMEQNSELQEKVRELSEKYDELEKSSEELKKACDDNDLLLEIYINLYKGNKQKARKLLETVSADDLTDVQKSFYNILVKKSK